MMERLRSLAGCRPLSVGRGDVIARRGLPLPGVLVVGTGSVKLSLRGAEVDERVLRIVGPGDAFGEPAAMLGKPCLYDAIALSEASLVVVPAKAILARVASDARFARFMVLALATRSYTLLTELEAATTQRGAQRLASYLDSLRRPHGRAVQLPVSKTVVAALLGMKKETLSRLLRQFTADGIIGVARREISILDTKKLGETARPAR